MWSPCSYVHEACWEILAGKEYGFPTLLKRKHFSGLWEQYFTESFCFLSSVVRAYVSVKHTLFNIWFHHLTGWQKPTELAWCRAQQMEHRLLPTVARIVVWFCCDWTAKQGSPFKNLSINCWDLWVKSSVEMPLDL